MNCRQINIFSTFLAVAAILLGGCGPGGGDSAIEKTAVVVASPYIEAAARDLLGGETKLVNLSGPNMCPGHFDMRPSQVRELAGCRLLLRFDFQEGLDEKLAGRGIAPEICSIVPAGGLCLPETYLGVCRRLADQFTADGTIAPEDAERRLAAIERRLTALREEAERRIDAAGIRGAPVLCSMHQEEFCRWLGLSVAAVFPSADTASTGGIDQAVTGADAAGVRLVVANRPEGRRAADALADRLCAAVVVFDNFPEPAAAEAFDSLVRGNISALTETIAGGY